jgi:hypothetical protein
MLVALLEEGDLGRADLLSPAVAEVCGQTALATVQEVARRKAAGGYDKTLLFQADVYDALETLGEDPRGYGLDPCDPITRQFNEMMWGPDESTWAGASARGPDEGDEPREGLPPLAVHDLGGHSRKDLAAWCQEFDLDTGGGKDELVERLGEFLENEFPPVEPLSGTEVTRLGAVRLRELLDRYGLPTQGGSDDLEERLLWLFDNARRDLGPPPAVAGEAARAMGREELVDLCRMWDVDPSGDVDVLVRMVLEAQENHASGARPWPPGGSGEGVVPPGTFDGDPPGLSR